MFLEILFGGERLLDDDTLEQYRTTQDTIRYSL